MHEQGAIKRREDNHMTKVADNAVSGVPQSFAELQAAYIKLQAEMQTLAASKSAEKSITLSIGQKGGVQFNGVNARFPMSCYASQAVRLHKAGVLCIGKDLQAFILKHADQPLLCNKRTADGKADGQEPRVLAFRDPAEKEAVLTFVRSI
jgi:hypothetical protein